MNPIHFKEVTVTYAKDQPQYLPLPAHESKDGVVTSCWELSFWEKLKVLFTGKLYISMMTFNNPPYPILPSIDKPDLEVV